MRNAPILVFVHAVVKHGDDEEVVLGRVAVVRRRPLRRFRLRVAELVVLELKHL